MSEDELRKIQEKRALDYQRQAQAQQQQEDMAKEMESRKNSILMNILTEDARQRLANIKLARPETAAMLENQLISLAQSRRISQKINDSQLRQMLAQITPKSRERNIRIVRK